MNKVYDSRLGFYKFWSVIFRATCAEDDFMKSNGFHLFYSDLAYDNETKTFMLSSRSLIV